MLVGLGCDMDHADNEGNTVWLAAAQSHNVELLRKLLEYGCNLHATNKAACTALHYACKSGETLVRTGKIVNFDY
jgi:ankyrin repeat protein